MKDDIFKLNKFYCLYCDTWYKCGINDHTILRKLVLHLTFLPISIDCFEVLPHLKVEVHHQILNFFL